MDSTETDDESLVGEACHIVAQKENGPRGQSELSSEQRDMYANLVLLCNVHHKEVDDQPQKYSVDVLHQIKNDHEQWVREQLGTYDAAKQRDDETYAGYVDEWQNRANLDGWKVWTSSILLHGQPSLDVEIDQKLTELRDWLFSRIWPRRYPDLEEAFHNFRLVLQDFQNQFHQHAEQPGEARLITRKFYHIDEWNEELYEKLSEQYRFHVALVEDLMLELTRAANYVCDKIREYLIHSYRLNEGALLIESGPYMPDLRFHTFRVEYRGEERAQRPYPGLERFKEVRFSRDYCFGKSEDE